MTSKIQISKRSMDYSTRKSVKWAVYKLRGSFDLENRSDFQSGPTSSIVTKSKSPKNPRPIAHENWQNGGFARFEARLTLKMDRFSSRDQSAP
ncbi:hypothetical protein H5410_056464 [Solanum commersonii]|uniref:Uncharacterized protein n=1 Tax=Solanum commersonii TaxID=4109 RepID=A0A9J5WLD4_SOLCO|nr:hypothetical protein H5410_056464 [Solanum commersonii]